MRSVPDLALVDTRSGVRDFSPRQAPASAPAFGPLLRVSTPRITPLRREHPPQVETGAWQQRRREPPPHLLGTRQARPRPALDDPGWLHHPVLHDARRRVGSRFVTRSCKRSVARGPRHRARECDRAALVITRDPSKENERVRLEDAARSEAHVERRLPDRSRPLAARRPAAKRHDDAPQHCPGANRSGSATR